MHNLFWLCTSLHTTSLVTHNIFGWAQCYSQLFLVTYIVMHNFFWLRTLLCTTFFGNVRHYIQSFCLCTLLNTAGLGYAQCYTQRFGYTQCYAQLFLFTHNIMHNFWLGTLLHTTFFVRHFIMHNIFCQAHYYARHFWQCTLLDKALLLTHIVKHNLFWLCTMLVQQFFFGYVYYAN